MSDLKNGWNAKKVYWEVCTLWKTPYRKDKHLQRFLKKICWSLFVCTVHYRTYHPALVLKSSHPNIYLNVEMLSTWILKRSSVHPKSEFGLIPNQFPPLPPVCFILFPLSFPSSLEFHISFTNDSLRGVGWIHSTSCTVSSKAPFLARPSLFSFVSFG